MEAWAVSFSLILARVGAFVAAQPLFGGRQVPRLVKVGLAFSLATLWIGDLAPPADPESLQIPTATPWLGYALAVVRELGSLPSLLPASAPNHLRDFNFTMRTFWIFLATAVYSYAQGSLELCLAKAVDIALTPEGSARVALAQQSIRQAETHVEGARASFFPTVDGSVQDRYQTVNLHTFGFNFTFPIPGFSLPAIVGPFNVFDARASVTAIRLPTAS